MTIATQVRSLSDRLRDSWRILLKEIAAFGLVGLVSLGVDLGLYNLLLHHGALKAKIVSTLVSTTVAYLGNRHLSFSHRARIGVARETTYFFGINLAWLGVSLAVLGIFTYPLHFRDDRFVLNVVNFVTIALGTAFRFWSYKRFVFLHPDRAYSPDVDLDEELAE